MTIMARYVGTCGRCGGQIQIGDRIEWERGERSSHVTCPKRPAQLGAAPRTQANIINALFSCAASLGHVVDGNLYKPDAHPADRGPCTRCGRSGVWISGAGQHLCARHQDDY